MFHEIDELLTQVPQVNTEVKYTYDWGRPLANKSEGLLQQVQHGELAVLSKMLALSFKVMKF
jgi:hypothetical protein